jgi:hypothetical protein
VGLSLSSLRFTAPYDETLIYLMRGESMSIGLIIRSGNTMIMVLRLRCQYNATHFSSAPIIHIRYVPLFRFVRYWPTTALSRLNLIIYRCSWLGIVHPGITVHALTQLKYLLTLSNPRTKSVPFVFLVYLIFPFFASCVSCNTRLLS